MIATVTLDESAMRDCACAEDCNYDEAKLASNERSCIMPYGLAIERFSSESALSCSETSILQEAEKKALLPAPKQQVVPYIPPQTALASKTTPNP